MSITFSDILDKGILSKILYAQKLYIHFMICYDAFMKGAVTMEANVSRKERFTTYLPTEMIEKIRKLSEDTRIPQSRLYEEAVEDLMKKYKNK